MQVFTSTSILVFLSVTFVSCHQEDEILPEIDFLSIDRSNYVDPHDMLNYDRRATKAPPDETIEAKTTLDTQNDFKNGPHDSEENTEVSETKFKPECQTNISPVNCSCLNNTSLEREKPFLGRFVAILSRTLELKEKHIEDGDVLYIPLLAVVSKRTQFVLSEILKEGGNIHLKNLADLDEVLSNLLILDKKKSEAPSLTIFEMVLSNIFFNPKDWLVTMFIASLWMMLWMTCKGYSYSYILSRSILPFGIVSWYWHWNYMDQVASAKRQSDLQKNTDLPEACNPEKLGILGDMKLWFSKTIMKNPDPCEEYHRAYFTDPTYEVNPLIALFDMLIKVVFHPLGYMGEKLGSFFDGVLSSPFWMYKIPVLVAVVAVLFLILVLAFGYEVHLPFFKIRPSVSSQSPTLPSTEALRDSTRENAIADVHSQCRLDQRAVTLGRSCSQVQTIERTTQESTENCPEESVSYAFVGVTQRHSCQQCAVTLGLTSSHAQTIEGTVYECHCLTQRNSSQNHQCRCVTQRKSHEQRTVTLQHNCLHVQTTEGTVQDSSEDCSENPDSPATHERRTGNPVCTRVSCESNSSEVASKMLENVPEKCAVIAPEKSVQT